MRDRIALIATGTLLVLIAANLVSLAQYPEQLARAWGGDYRFYMGATERWLGGGGFYADYQLSGPYEVYETDVLFPPVVLVLFVPFTVLPAVLWWAVPLGIVAWCCRRLRPAVWSWPLILAVLWWPHTETLIIAGNPVMWSVAALALGTLYAWPSVLVMLKPSLFPFALFGCWRRSWWVSLAAYVLVSALFLPMWFDYATVLQHASGPRASVLHSVPDIPFMLLPLIAWIGRRQSGITAPSVRFLRR